jgi:hypothetical protein
MSGKKFSEEEWQTLVVLAGRLGICLPALDGRPPRFSELELAAHRLGRAIAQGTTSRLAAARAEQSAERELCPTCGSSCPIEQQERELITLDGPAELLEPVAHCSACRRDFFPSACRSGSGSAAE